MPLLGNFPIGPFSPTIIDITVFVAALMIGAKGGALVGGFWGLITFVRAFTFPSSPIVPLVFTNPLISIAPKNIMGVLCAWLFTWLHRRLPLVRSMSLAIIVTEIVTAILTLGPIYWFYASPKIATALGAPTSADFGHVLLVIVLTNAVPETILAALVTPTIMLSLKQSGLGGDILG